MNFELQILNASRTDMVLPPSFDLVVLGRKEKEMVIAAGRNPDRKEADMANGEVINKVYDPNAQIVATQNSSQPGPQADMNANASQLAPGLEAVAQSAQAAQQQHQQDIADGEAAMQALQDAPMMPEAPIGGGVPDAPMMPTAEMSGDLDGALVDGSGPPATPSESLGEGAPTAPSADDGLSEQASLVEAGTTQAVNA